MLMQINHQFTVSAPVEQAWLVMRNLEMVAPCMPGATLTSYDGQQFTGNVRVRIGPISLTYEGKGRVVEEDAAGHRFVVAAGGRDARGAGTADATITVSMAAAAGGTTVDVVADVAITGKAAQFGR